MIKVFFSSTLLCLSISVGLAQTPNLQAVTAQGRTTDQWIQLTGIGGFQQGVTTGAGLELYANSSNVIGYVKVYNRTTATPGTLKLQDSGGNTYINETGGNVGIGTNTPVTKLDVKGNVRISDGLQTINLLNGTNTSGYALSVGANDDGVNFSNNSNVRGFKFSNINGTLLTITSTGNVGLGTSSPLNGTTNTGLHINKGNHSTIVLGDPTAGYGGFVQTTDNKHRVFIGANVYDDQTNSWKVPEAGKGLAGISIVADEGGWGTSIDFYTNTGATLTKNMTILGNGNVGIGTSTTGSYKLAVEGTIGARRVKVTQAAWADFVFDEGYKLPPLQEVEQYVREHKHLPDVPSGEEVAKNGLDLGDMNKKLLQKIEELTLYLFEVNKQNEELKTTVNDLKAKVAQLTSRN